jgi:hypothetical protein
MAVERWKEVAGFPGYQVSDRGRVRNAYKKVLKCFQKRMVVLCRGEKTYCRSVPRMVAEAFIGPVPKGVRVHKIRLDVGYIATNLRIGK